MAEPPAALVVLGTHRVALVNKPRYVVPVERKGFGIEEKTLAHDHKNTDIPDSMFESGQKRTV